MPFNDLSVIAIVTIRNGAYYFNRLCTHLNKNGIALAVIDNDSDDNLQELIEKNKETVISSTMLAYEGHFDLTKQLRAKQSLAGTLKADWIIHLDVDELLFSDVPGETLNDAISRVDSLGFDAINFDEFVFLPIKLLSDYSSDNFHQMRWYYFFEPRPKRLIRAFKSNLETRIDSGGHDVVGVQNLYVKNMIMRHYMFENRSHLETKYRDRTYSNIDMKNRFHGNRLLLQSKPTILPSRKRLVRAKKSAWILNSSAPKTTHFWQW